MRSALLPIAVVIAMCLGQLPTVLAEYPLIPSWSPSESVDSTSVREGELVDLWIACDVPFATGFEFAGAEFLNCLDVVGCNGTLETPAAVSYVPTGGCGALASVNHYNCPIISGFTAVMRLTIRAPQLGPELSEDTFGLMVAESTLRISEEDGCSGWSVWHSATPYHYVVLRVRTAVPVTGITWGSVKAMYE